MLFHRGWHDAHHAHVPDGLTLRRTPQAFRERVVQRIAETDDTTVVEVEGVLAGFIMVTGDEVEQLYVDRAFRGAGLATVLLEEGEHQVSAGGHDQAWLAVVEGNARARRFYEKGGWVDDGDLPYEVMADGQRFVSPCRRYAKNLAPDASST